MSRNESDGIYNVGEVGPDRSVNSDLDLSPKSEITTQSVWSTIISNAIVVAVGSAGPIAIAVTALILNFRLFHSLERRIEVIESDLKLQKQIAVAEK